MTRYNKTIGVLLLIAVALLYVPIPLIDEKTIAAIGIAIIGIISLIRK